jgi:hypothetical protein
VDRNAWTSTYDRDLDVQSSRAAGPTEPIDAYRRLVANPLLAVASCVLALVLLRASLQWRSLASFLMAIGLFSISIFFTQFHCLDCGRTIWLSAARRHACPMILSRWRAGLLPRWRFPGLKTQIVLWLYFLASATALILILFVLSR